MNQPNRIAELIGHELVHTVARGQGCVTSNRWVMYQFVVAGQISDESVRRSLKPRVPWASREKCGGLRPSRWVMHQFIGT